MALIGTRSGDDVGATAPRNLHSGTTVWSALYSEIPGSVKWVPFSEMLRPDYQNLNPLSH